jgi:hypothetical protein
MPESLAGAGGETLLACRGDKTCDGSPVRGSEEEELIELPITRILGITRS